MAIIYTYPVKTTPANDDLILISDSADGNKTKQIKVSSMPGANGSGITSLGVSGSGQTGATQTLASGNAFLTIASSANTHTFNINGALPTSNGGTGLTSIGTAHQVLSVNSAANALEYANPKVTKIVTNETGSTILAGTPVYISGVTGSTPTIAIADASDNNKLPVAGLLTADIADGSDGTIMVTGSVTSVRTNDIPGASAVGDLIYLGAAAGSGSIPFLTATKPTGANSIQALGIISKFATTGQGIIEVNIQSSVEGLPNFGAKGSLWVGADNGAVRNLTLGTDEHVLTADSSVTGGVKWAASPASGVTTINFDTTGLTPNIATTGAVTVAGTLAAKNGGTGVSSYTAGDLLYASGATTLVKLPIGTAGKVLTVNSGATAPEWANPSVTAAGATGNIQFNDGSNAFTASANLSYTTGTNTLNVGVQGTAIGNLNVNGSSSAVGILKLGGQGSGVSAPFVKLQASGSSSDTYTMIMPRDVPTLNQSLYISSASGSGTGTTVQLNARDTTPVANGGTGQSATAQYSVFVGTSTTAVQKSADATGAIQLPSGNTAAQPTGVNGMIRYNNQTHKVEAYVNGTWTALH